MRIFCRWKELYAYEADIEPAIQFPLAAAFVVGLTPVPSSPAIILPC